jgi:hypothetical protein
VPVHPRLGAQGSRFMILLANRSGIVVCDGTRGRNPSVSDISREFVRQRLEVRQPPNANHP